MYSIVDRSNIVQMLYKCFVFTGIVQGFFWSQRVSFGEYDPSGDDVTLDSFACRAYSPSLSIFLKTSCISCLVMLPELSLSMTLKMLSMSGVDMVLV